MNPFTITKTATCASVALAAVLIACAPASPARTTSPQVRTAQMVPTTWSDAEDAGTVSPKALHCRFEVSEARGCDVRDVEALLEPTRARLEACRGSSGKVRIRVYDEGGRMKFRFEPGSSLDATQRRCVLEALSTIGTDGVSSLSTGASVRPTGFSSLLTIEW